jgi:cholesterol transport system auxiliary component
LRGDRVVVRPAPLQLEYLAGVRWAERPGPMIQRLVETLLRRQDKLILLGTRQLGIPADFRLDGKLEAFELDVTRADPVAVVIYDATLVRSKPARLTGTRRFEAQVTARDDGPDAMIDALNQAANQVAGQVAVWISEELPPG